jgi:hypothetical protein
MKLELVLNQMYKNMFCELVKQLLGTSNLHVDTPVHVHSFLHECAHYHIHTSIINLRDKKYSRIDL